MNGWLNSLVDSGVQCWGCAVFDKLFQILTVVIGAIYAEFSRICVILFCLLFVVFIINAIYKNVKAGIPDPWMTKSVQKVFISALIVLTIMGTGIAFPRFISTVLFEPVADITAMYSQSMMGITEEQVAERVQYETIDVPEDSVFRPQLRDKIVNVMKSTVTQFQRYIKLGLAVMDHAFSWRALQNGFIKYLIMFFVGLSITWNFIKIFFRYCCYFVDIIIAMAFFAVFFPLSLVAFIFKGAEHVPEWISKLGASLGTGQVKNVINSIVTLGSVVISYTIITIIIVKFFSVSGTSYNEIMESIASGQVYTDILNSETLESMSLIGCAVLGYILSFIMEQIPQISKMILGAFNVAEKSDDSEALANDLTKLIDKGIDKGKDLIGKIKGDSGGATASATPSGGTSGGA